MQESTITALSNVVKDLQIAAGMVRSDTAAVLETSDPIQIVQHFDRLRITMEQVKEAREALQQITDDLSMVQIPTLFTNKSLKTLTIEGVGRVTVSYRFSASMLDKDAGFAWLRDNGAGELIKPTVNAQTLSAFVKNRLEEEGKDVPEDIFKVGTAPYTSITKVK